LGCFFPPFLPITSQPPHLKQEFSPLPLLLEAAFRRGKASMIKIWPRKLMIINSSTRIIG
jgi:hypothetical protein